LSSLFIEAESFSKLGGWLVEQQSIRQMGSSYIMAHGLGIPVEDACETITISQKNKWIFWVRTRDWSAVWSRGTSAGTFQLLVDHKATPVILGTNGSVWKWQKAGTVVLDKGLHEIALHDLTGFNSRCDAIYLTTDENDIPPDENIRLAEFRKEKLHISIEDDPCIYDLAIAGGGVAAVCCAYAAVQSGLKVVLLQDRNLLGGCNSSEIRVSMGGLSHTPPYENIGNVVEAIQPVMGSGRTYDAEFYEDARKKNIFSHLDKNMYQLLFNEHVIHVENDKNNPKAITAFISRNTLSGKESRFRAKQFADCTGDAVIARMMNAEVMTGRESYDRFHESLAPQKGDRQVMGMSVLWKAEESENDSVFPDIDWGVDITEDTAYYVTGGDWEWECGQNSDQAEQTEYIRDYGLMTIFANWSYLKNHSKRKDEWAKYALNWITPLGGKRESYRVVGDHILTQNDIEERTEYEDMTVGISWNIDIHMPDPQNEANFKEPFRSCAYHRGIGQTYAIPYRCIYARDVDNLFLGGRTLSASHVAFSCVRVMRTLGALGEVIGMAASICVKEKVNPRGVYEKHFDKLKALMEKGIKVHTYHGWPCSYQESYHFKDTGHIEIYPHFKIDLEDKELCERIKKLNIPHRLPETNI